MKYAHELGQPKNGLKLSQPHFVDTHESGRDVKRELLHDETLVGFRPFHTEVPTSPSFMNLLEVS